MAQKLLGMTTLLAEMPKGLELRGQAPAINKGFCTWLAGPLDYRCDPGVLANFGGSPALYKARMCTAGHSSSLTRA
jgi:hypothetical protein